MVGSTFSLVLEPFRKARSSASLSDHEIRQIGCWTDLETHSKKERYEWSQYLLGTEEKEANQTLRFLISFGGTGSPFHPFVHHPAGFRRSHVSHGHGHGCHRPSHWQLPIGPHDYLDFIFYPRLWFFPCVFRWMRFRFGWKFHTLYLHPFQMSVCPTVFMFVLFVDALLLWPRFWI